MFSLASHCALVTGASRGIGLSIATRFAKQGAYVIGTATTQAGADLFTEYLAHLNLKGQGLILDLSSAHSIEQLVEALNNCPQFPTILVNNAGIARDNLLLRLKEEEWQVVIDTNLGGVYRLTKALLRSMLKAKWGRIINISSIVGVTGNAGQSNYAAAKAGLIGFSKSLALEVANRGITVNVIAPGFIETDMTASLSEIQRSELFKRIPCQRLGTPEDISSACIFLDSKEALYITGQTLHINGGLAML